MEEAYKCIICGEDAYPSTEKASCSYCGKVEKADYLCGRGHYICEECRLASPEELVKKTCQHSGEKDPVKIAELLMKHPAITAYGPEHHYMVAAVILAALRNNGIVEVDASMIDRAIARAKRIPLGACGSWGACGAAVGVGIAFSVAWNVDMMSEEGRSVIMKLVSEALEEISKIKGPRCCKASVYAALNVVKRFLKERFNVSFVEQRVRCPFKAVLRQHCLGVKCPYYGE